MKKEIGTISAVPSKRLFLSIIADYDLNRSVCELVDNALDVWVRGGRKKKVSIKIELEEDQKTVCVEDDAGGLRRDELRYVVGPGQTGTSSTDETIGIFGVGTKRAVVALAQDVRIITRFGQDATYQIDFDDKWLSDESWDLPLYAVDDISPGTTRVELQRLRVTVNEEAINLLREHLGATYGKFLQNKNIAITLNGRKVTPEFFENWAYPPSYEPRHYTGELPLEDGGVMNVEVLAGLSNESSPATGAYGVYFYCNDRLITRGMKSLEVGFTRGLAGLPHPKVSLTKVIVSLKGSAASMPWNSSKSDISTKHSVFVALQSWLVTVVKDYAALSRIWMGEWPDKVFRYDEGQIREVAVADFPSAKKSYLPPAPISRPRFGDVVTQINQKLAKAKPWVRGLYEGIIAADVIEKQKLTQRNRIALIVLDSTMEIAFKEFLVNESGVGYGDTQLLTLFKNRIQVHAEIKKYTNIPQATWKKIVYFYNLRCDLVHKKAEASISDDQIADFREIVEDVLNRLYKLKFERA
jgi:Histidine kinase-, DNA gyrase B-, and HSP90-like ATPase